MKSAVVLSLVGAALAQISVDGYSMITIANSEPTQSSYASDYYGSSAPAQYTSDAASSSYSAPPSEYTTPPSSSSYDIYSMMPYSSMTEGGYKSLDCGYGYSKAYDGSCQSMSWVRFALICEGK